MSQEEEAADVQSEILVVGCSRVGKAELVEALAAIKHQPYTSKPNVASSTSTSKPLNNGPLHSVINPQQAVDHIESGHASPPANSTSPPSAGPTPSALVPWRIHTKYYTADVNFRIHTLQQTGSANSPSLTLASSTAPEALVLVFDATREATFAAVQEWAQHHQQEEIVEQAEIRLVVSTNMDNILLATLPYTASIPSQQLHTSNTTSTNITTNTSSHTSEPVSHARLSPRNADANSDTNAERSHTAESVNCSQQRYQQAVAHVRPSWHEAVADWCVGHGWEYVETCAAVPELDRQLQVEGDKHGVGRVVEALSAHMWPGLVEIGEDERSLHHRHSLVSAQEDSTNLEDEQHEQARYVPPQKLACDLELHQSHPTATPTPTTESTNMPGGSMSSVPVADILAGGRLSVAEVALGSEQGSVGSAAATTSATALGTAKTELKQMGGSLLSQDVEEVRAVSKPSASSNGRASGAAEDGEKHVDDFEKLMGEMQGEQ